MDIIVLILPVALVALYLYNSKELRAAKCKKCGGASMSIYELKTDLIPHLHRGSSLQLLLNPNKYITKLQCNACGHFQEFKPKIKSK